MTSKKTYIDRGSNIYKKLRAAFLAECKARNTPCTGWPGCCGQPIDYHAAPQTDLAFELCHIVAASVNPSLAYVRANFAAGHHACNRRAGASTQQTIQPVPTGEWIRPTW